MHKQESEAISHSILTITSFGHPCVVHRVSRPQTSKCDKATVVHNISLLGTAEKLQNANSSQYLRSSSFCQFQSGTAACACTVHMPADASTIAYAVSLVGCNRSLILKHVFRSGRANQEFGRLARAYLRHLRDWFGVCGSLESNA